jgi:hypothetical protein
MQYAVADKTYGTVAAERRNEMNGIDFVRGLVEGTLPLNTIARTLGYEVSEVTEGPRGRHRDTDGRAAQPGRYGAWRVRGDAAR